MGQGCISIFVFYFIFCLNSSDKLSKHNVTPHSCRASFLSLSSQLCLTAVHRPSPVLRLDLQPKIPLLPPPSFPPVPSCHTSQGAQTKDPPAPLVLTGCPSWFRIQSRTAVFSRWSVRLLHKRLTVRGNESGRHLEVIQLDPRKLPKRRK